MRTNSGGRASLRRWITTSALAAAGLLFAKPAAAQVSVSVFGDVDYEAKRDNGNATNPAATTNAFSAPRIELFLTSTQGKLAFLAETMFEVGDGNTFGVDVERIEVGYLFSDKFRLRVGRFHTAIGYYNDAYHHGRYFQMTVDRPTMVRFEDEGGLIPAHSVGIHADGRLPVGAGGNIRYDAEITNGRGSTPGMVDNLEDPNNGKMYNLRLRFEPAAIDGLVIGGSAAYDVIPASVDGSGAPPLASIRELIFGGHIAYLENRTHVIGEYLFIQHHNDSASWTGVTQSAFLELGYDAGIIGPYVRGELAHFPADTAANDPFFANNALFLSRGSSKSGVVGVRSLLSDFLALKLEGEYVHRDDGGSIRSVAAQCAFAF
jgi:Gram-negative porin